MGNVADSPGGGVKRKGFTARATNGRPYILYRTVPAFYQNRRAAVLQRACSFFSVPCLREAVHMGHTQNAESFRTGSTGADAEIHRP